MRLTKIIKHIVFVSAFLISPASALAQATIVR